MGTVFRLLNHRGLSTRRLAAAVGITQGRLYDYMNNKSRVEKLALFEQISDALRIPGGMLGLAKRPWEPRGAEPVAGPILEPDGNDLAAIDAFRNADKQTGGGRLYAAVIRHLKENIASRLVDAGSEPQVFAAAAALSEMAGWMAHDSGRDARAQSHFARALPLARTSGDAPLAANIAASSSHLALQVGEVGEAVHWAKVGLQFAGQGPQIPSLTARLYSMHARALAVADQGTVALRELERAHDALTSSAEATHPWISPFDEASLASESALTYRDMKRYDGALEYADRAVTLRESGRARSLAMSQINLVATHAYRGDLDAVLHFGVMLLTTNPSLGSVRVINQLTDLRRMLDSHSDHRPVRDFLERFDVAAKTRLLLLADIMAPGNEGTLS
ncbi:helix-turn-helix transcriptional regulator [Streptomyces bugieae]|uniref:Helix-turn-helix transcriptional regulator n=1 Tax=Streptomyces bugieae TaxID=3098223 RepID=A0ABU7NQN7_9ACTN|nr:helix-turn-helix transcriptional regulator [Streptomyces sp. DSM 41528]